MIDIKKELAKANVLFGTEEVMKNLKLGKLEKVFLSSNCPNNVKEDINYYADLSGAKVAELDVPNNELGVLCKKPFSVSVLGLLKEQKK